MGGELLQTLDTRNDDFDQRLNALLDRDAEEGRAVEGAVEAIIEEVKRRGDDALLEYTRKFDRWDPAERGGMQISAGVLAENIERIDAAERAALHAARDRIDAFHKRQKETSWEFTDADGSTYGQLVTPLERVGVYVPGGKAAYPSSVLMNVVPAKVAGVDEVVMVVPMPDGVPNPLVLAAAAIAGVDRVFAIGGAQAIAALAYGTESVPRVDKIVGPGNVYVATAKRQVFGQVGIDMIAGPSEVVVICDGGANPDWVAMDLFAQAEHDEMAQSIAICLGEEVCARVFESIQRLLPGMERRDVIEAALGRQGALITVRDADEAVAVANRIAPEHLELLVEAPQQLIPRIRHAGAVFAGYYSAESLGDYCAGPNHVLPTSGTARFSSPLGVYDFQKRTSLIMCSQDGARKLAGTASTLARAESLTAHARSAEYRGDSHR